VRELTGKILSRTSFLEIPKGQEIAFIKNDLFLLAYK
jgi:hypothetical protein